MLWLYSRRVLPPYVKKQVRLACSRGKACTAGEGGLPAQSSQSLLAIKIGLCRYSPKSGSGWNAKTIGLRGVADRTGGEQVCSKGSEKRPHLQVRIIAHCRAVCNRYFRPTDSTRFQVWTASSLPITDRPPCPVRRASLHSRSCNGPASLFPRSATAPGAACAPRPRPIRS